MSNNNSKSFSADDIERPEEGEEEEEGEELDEEIEEGEEEGVYVEEEDEKDLDEEPRVIDLSKLTPKQKKDLENNRKRLLFLKALAINHQQDFVKLGRKVGFTKDAMAQELVQIMMGMITNQHEKPDFPAKILKYFNRLLPDNYPGKETLDEADINELGNLFKLHEQMAQQKVVFVDPDMLFGDNVAENLEKAKAINAAMIEQKTYMDSYQSAPPPQQQPQYFAPPQQPPQPQQTVDNGQGLGFYPQAPKNNKEFYLNKYDNQDIGIMEYALRSIFNPRPNFVPGFINNFIDLYNNWINNPSKIQEQLVYTFGEKAGTQAYLLWRDLREDLKRNIGGGGSLYSSPKMSFSQGLDDDYQRELMQERRQEKRMKQLMDMMQMKFMETAMQAQTPTLPGAMGGNFEEVLDSNGKVIKRIYMNNGGGGNGAASAGTESATITALTNIFNTMMTGANQEKVELLRKVSSPDTTWQTLAQSMLNNHLNQQNPAAIANQLIEVANVLRPNSGNNDISKSIEATKLEVDTKLAMKELELKHAELQHNWRMDEKQSQEQDSNVDKWLGMLQSVSTDLIKPVALKFVEGFGKGGAGNPLGAMFGGQQQAQQPQQPSEQEIAQAQQEYYMNQQRAAQQQQQQQGEPPLEPMGPPPQQRYYNHPQEQQRPRNQPLNEQELQQQLSVMAPEQLEELHDNLEMEDIKRERAKNMIKAMLNAKRSRGTQPQPQAQPQQAVQQPQPQQQTAYDAESIRKAQQTLNFDTQTQEEEEEEEEYDEEQDYEVPIAAGQDREKRPRNKRNSVNTYGDEEYDTSELNHKKLNRQEKALLAQGEISPEELTNIEDQDIEEEEDNAVPIAGVYNESDEKNRKKTKTTRKKKEEIVKDENDNVVAEAEEVLEQVEEIPSDDI